MSTRRFYGLLVLLALFLTTLLLTAPTSAFAQPVPPGGDTFQRGCKMLQDQAKDLAKEYFNPGTTDARRQEILQEFRNTESDWKAIGCQGVWGDILAKPPRKSPVTTVGSAPFTRVKGR